MAAGDRMAGRIGSLRPSGAGIHEIDLPHPCAAVAFGTARELASERKDRARPGRIGPRRLLVQQPDAP